MGEQPRHIPKLFNAEMVQAMLAGRKTETRRIFKDAPVDVGHWWRDPETGFIRCQDRTGTPYGRHFGTRTQTGDLIWVRENFQISGIGWGKKPSEAIGGKVHYKADPDHGWHSYWGGWHPSIHMPKWASRLTLVVTDYRIERLHDIDETGAIAEGCGPFFDENDPRKVPSPNGGSIEMMPIKGPVDAYAALWDKINGNGAWTANPWVEVTSYTPHLCNIDRMAG